MPTVLSRIVRKHQRANRTQCLINPLVQRLRINPFETFFLLAHVWTNLLGNAAKFAPDGGRVSVRLRRDGAFAEVTVADNGPGMDEQTQRRAFEKFYQGDASHASEGNGLGLPLAKRIVDLHNGTLTATSAPGKGVTFTARVPGAVGERAVF